MNFSPCPPSFSATVLAAFLCQGPAGAAQPPARIDVSSFPAAMVEDVVVPVPSEVFAVLDKLGTPDWKSEMRDVRSGALRDRPQIALLLGTVIANGFIAVQAEDPEPVKDIGREVLRLAGAIGVRDSVVRRSKSIIDAADQRNWRLVRTELDKALQDVRIAMTELNDEQLAQLVSLGGWLRGTEALTSIIGKSYSRDGAELLHQPGLFEYFQHRLGALPPPLKSNDLLTQIEGRLAEMRPMIEVQDGREISPEAVSKIHSITAALVAAIVATQADGSTALPPAPAN